MSQRPVVARKTRIVLWTGLLSSFALLVDMIIQLANTGELHIEAYTTLAAALFTIAYISTLLIIICIRKRSAAKTIPANGLHTSSSPFPVASTVPSIISAGVLALLYTTVFIPLILPRSLSEIDFKAPAFKAQIIVGAVFEGICGCMILILLVFGVRERRRVGIENQQRAAENTQPYFIGPAAAYSQLFAGKPFFGNSQLIAQPFVGNLQGVTGGIQPFVENSQLVAAGSTQPHVENTRPGIGSIQPFYGYSQLVTGSAEPFSRKQRPAFRSAQSQPVAGISESSFTGKARPVAGRAQPLVEDSQPVAAGPQPFVEAQQDVTGGDMIRGGPTDVNVVLREDSGLQFQGTEELPPPVYILIET